MPEPIRSEIAAAAVVKENLTTTPATLDERLAAAVSQNLSEGNFTEALRKFGEVDDVDFDKISETTNNFGTEVNERTGNKKLSKQEEELAKRVNTALGFDKKLLEVGYSKLTPAEKTKARQEVITSLRKLPYLSEQIRTAESAGKLDALAERYLNNPAIIALLKGELNEAALGEFDGSVLDLFDELQAKKAEQSEIADELAEIERRSKLLAKQEAQFRTDDSGQPEPAAIKAIRYNTLTHEGARQTRTNSIQSQTKELQDAQAEVRDLEARQAAELSSRGQQRVDPRINQYAANIAAIDTNLTNLRNRLAGIPENDPTTRRDVERRIQANEENRNTNQANLDALTPPTTDNAEVPIAEQLRVARGRASEAQTELDKLRGEEQEIRDLEAEKEQVEQRRIQLESEKREIMGRRRAIDNAVNKAQRDYSSAQSLRVAQESNLTSKVENALGSAAQQLAMEELDKANQAIDAELEKLKQETADINVKAMVDYIQRRHVGAVERKRQGLYGLRREVTTRPLNRTQIRLDMDMLIDQGPDILMRNYLSHTINPATTGNYTVDQIDALMKDKDFVNQMQQRMIVSLLAKAQKTGGFSQEDVYAISTSDWGKGKLELARQENEEVRREMEATFGAGALNRHGFSERWGQVVREKPWLILLLFGIPAALGMGALQEAVNQQR